MSMTEHTNHFYKHQSRYQRKFASHNGIVDINEEQGISKTNDDGDISYKVLKDGNVKTLKSAEEFDLWKKRNLLTHEHRQIQRDEITEPATIRIEDISDDEEKSEDEKEDDYFGKDRHVNAMISSAPSTQPIIEETDDDDDDDDDSEISGKEVTIYKPASRKQDGGDNTIKSFFEKIDEWMTNMINIFK